MVNADKHWYRDRLLCRNWLLDADIARAAGGRHSQSRAAAVFCWMEDQLMQLESSLGRLLGSYTNRPLPPDPTGGGADRSDSQAPIARLTTLVEQVAQTTSLVEDLGYSPATFRRVGAWIVALRSQLAHWESCPGQTPLQPFSLQQFFAVQKLQQAAGRLLQDRPQIWRAYLDSIIVDANRDVCYAGPNAVALPLPPPCYVITAANPREASLGEAENHRRNRMLETVLRERFERVIPVTGQSRCGRWQEPSFLISTPDRCGVLQLAARYGQRAVFELDEREKCVIAVDGTTQGVTSRTE